MEKERNDWAGPFMFRRLSAALRKRDPARYWGTLDRIRIRTQLSVAFARAAATSSLRVIDPQVPRTWEFSGFSQHGEDGIIDYLCSHLVNPNRFFFEIGAA